MNATIETFRTDIFQTSYVRPRGAVYTGRILSGIAVLFLALDTIVKLLAIPAAVEGTMKVGFTAGLLFPLAVIELVCLAAYLIPRIAPLGAILWTGYLGGAIATHLRLGDPLLTHTLFPIYVAAFLWAGLWLRDRRLGALFARVS